MKTYNTDEVKLTLEWVDKYFETSVLICNILGVNNSDQIPPIPSIEDEIEYQRQRSWFLQNHNKFVPIWADFCASTGNAIELISDVKGIEYKENPFLYFYYPNNLRDLVHTMGATSSPNIWDPNGNDLEVILNAVKMFSYTVMHLRYWIGEFS